MELSLIIPIYNEEVVIDTLFERTIKALEPAIDDFEIVCVDDGSSDSSLKKLVSCHRRDKRFKVISFSRNFGHQAAYTAGLAYVKGEYVAMMDGDLQDPPELIPEMLRKAEKENLDVVYGKREGRLDRGLKQFLIRGFHFIFTNVSGMQGIQDVGNFSVMNRKAVDALLSFHEKNRYLPGLRSFIGFRQGPFVYQRGGRLQGDPKMSWCKLFKLAFDAIFSFSDLPIKICLYTGLVGMLICFLAFFYIVMSKILNIAPYGWSSTTLAIFFLGFIQLVFLGILGEYLFRAYKESQGRPMYLISEVFE
jgi:glycosyltransferase involved in cell wall biosynthesis